ncbi:MAG: YqaA family protein [Brevundimonas sp.]|jgi:membrane protein YqaA with SNARE-associated domain|uniref:YqaA family protein n=1 Tax=Brevundimonas sp. TaxID=1871086 RepID=UPI00391B0317
MIRRLYHWTMRLAASRHATKAMAAVSFAESSFFPVPPDVVLAPMVLARPDRAYFYAAVCTLASVLGGMLGYVIGYFLEPVGIWMLGQMGKAEIFARSQDVFNRYGVWAVVIGGFTPLPYKVVTIASGIFAFSFPLFIALSVVTRGARYFMIAYVVRTFGPAMLPVIERRLLTFTVLGIMLLVGGFLLLRLL